MSQGPTPDVVVVGAGAAGILASWRAASLGARVLLLEKTHRLGTKILISGGGKCNIVHDGPMEDVLRAFRPNEARFIRPACYRFPNTHVMDLFTSHGLALTTRPDGRVFPLEGNAKDVVRILGDHLREVGVEVRYGAPVSGLEASDGRMSGVRALGGTIACERVVVSVGGCSYPNSGTTGDGYPWMTELGHTLVPVRAALAPMDTDPEPPSWAGVALRACRLRARATGKEVARWDGDLLFTHHGVSGPTVLGISREVEDALLVGPVELVVDLLPSVPYESVGEQILNWCREHPRRLVAGWFEEIAPSRLAVPLCQASAVDPELPASRLDKKGRNRMVETAKVWKLGRVSRVPIEKGEVVAGGVSLDEVDPKTMESRKVQGLYLSGELLDVAGPVGGYNLQAAFATGYVAGESAASTCMLC